jgi:hypothetical protein
MERCSHTQEHHIGKFWLAMDCEGLIPWSPREEFAMKKLLLVAALASVAFVVPADARGSKGKHRLAPHAASQTAPVGVEILERDTKGRATKIRREGQEYKVCTSDDSDGCINPREAGLGWGNNAIDSWPGREVSRDH